MSRFADLHYVFPPYGAEYREMDVFVEHWKQALHEAHRFRPGFHGGGILTIVNAFDSKDLFDRIRMRLASPYNPPRGLVLGNASGQLLARRVYSVKPYRPPAIAVRMGVEAVPEMSVAVTAEHLDGLGIRRYVLVVPKVGRRSVKGLAWLPGWFAHFGVSVHEPGPDDLPELRGRTADWFGDPTRALFALPISGGEEDLAWQLAVVCYVAQHWETRARGLQAVHYVADIEDKPNFRKFWTSNR